jgi:protein-L-isoaspartate(D-aspartate) O-methyltransferase
MPPESTLFDFLEDDMSSAEERAAFHMRLRGRGIQDLAVLRTLELVPRALFVPHRFADLAQKDVALPIGCGQTISEPWLVARMMESLDLAKQHKVLEVGSGAGYTAAILGQLAAEVISVERFQSLATEARARLGQMGIDNVGIVWGDGLALPRQLGSFDRIFVEGRLQDPSPFIDFLNDDGVLIYARTNPEIAQAQQLMRLTKTGDTSEQKVVATCRLQAMVPGLSRAL